MADIENYPGKFHKPDGHAEPAAEGAEGEAKAAEGEKKEGEKKEGEKKETEDKKIAKAPAEKK